ncbi:MAG: non-homologous end-joining DNA ligase [Chloroflexota bacterium]|nr:non-homologous end-joining DNA ligase [Chloroflexota bacterium]
MSADPVKIAGVAISNPDKVWWPDEGITKADIARFYDGMWSHLAPWVRDRPLTAERCPDGLSGSCFYQKDFPPDKPPPGPRLVLRATSTGKDVRYVVGGSRSTLISMVNLGCIAIHVMTSRAKRIREVDWLAFDMDPPESFADAARAALALRKVLDEARVVSYPKTSGSKGLHVFAPLRTGISQQDATAVAVALGEELARREPKLVTIEFSKAKRGGRVFADAMRNAYGQTIVPPYSVRRRPRAPVSTPLAWDEVSPRLDPAAFNVGTFDKRMARDDPWSDFWRRRQTLPKTLPA